MTVIEKIVKTLESLPSEDQQQVLGYAEGLAARHSGGQKSPRLLLRQAGTMDRDYAKKFMAIIEEGCEQVDLSEW